MVEAILKFSLPGENDEYLHATNGCLYHCALFDYLEKLRQIRKHDDLTPYSRKMFDRLEAEFIKTLNHYDIQF